MKHIDKKLSDDFSKFLNQKLFYKNDKPLKQTKNKLELFNRCTALFEEFVNTVVNKEPEITSSPIVPKDNRPTNKNVMSIKIVNPIDGGKGTTIMTASESMKADEQRGKK